MKPSDPSLTDYPQSLILPGVRLQEALKQGNGVKEAFDTYTRRAYRQSGAAAQASAFLATTFKGDAETLLQYVTSELLVDELSGGSHVLASIAAEHWDRHNGMDRLTELARKLNDSWSDKLNNHEALEFCLALVTAVAILHPDVAAKLLDHCEPACAGDPKLSEACADAREWQHSGELIAQTTPDQQRFWHEQLARRGGDWIWDTEEARHAVRALESANPEAVAKASLLVDRVPGWAWNIRVQRPEPKAAPAVPEAKIRKPSPALAILKWAAAVLVGVGLGALWDSAPMREFIASRSAQAPTHTESPAIVAAAPAAEVVQSPAAAPKPASVPVASPVIAQPTEGPRLVMASLPRSIESELPLATKPEDSAPAFATTKPTQANEPLTASQPAPKITADPPQAVSAQPVPAPAAEHPKLPEPPKPLVVAQATPPAITESEPPNAPTPNPTPPAEKPAPAAPQPTSPAPATPPAEKPVVVPEKPATPAPQPAAPAAQEVAKPAATPSSQADKPHNLHPDYFAKPATAPSNEARALTKKAVNAKPKASPAPEAQSDRVFVTRASSIRLRYRDGIWISEPGAYLEGAAGSPQEWARDMTLRERSSGSIPENYVFQVLRNGVVQVVPDPAKH